MPSYVTLLLTSFCNQFIPSSRKENNHLVQFVLQIASVLVYLSIDCVAVLRLHVLGKLAELMFYRIQSSSHLMGKILLVSVVYESVF